MGLAVVTTLFLVLHSLFRQTPDVVHLDVDNIGVVRHVGRLLDGLVGSCPAELAKDGDLILLIDGILEMRGRETVRVAMVIHRYRRSVARWLSILWLDPIVQVCIDEHLLAPRRCRR